MPTVPVNKTSSSRGFQGTISISPRLPDIPNSLPGKARHPQIHMPYNDFVAVSSTLIHPGVVPRTSRAARGGSLIHFESLQKARRMRLWKSKPAERLKLPSSSQGSIDGTPQKQAALFTEDPAHIRRRPRCAVCDLLNPSGLRRLVGEDQGIDNRVVAWFGVTVG